MPKKCPKSTPKVSKIDKKGAFYQKSKMLIQLTIYDSFIHSFHDKIQFKGLFNTILFNIQFKKSFNNLFSDFLQILLVTTCLQNYFFRESVISWGTRLDLPKHVTFLNRDRCSLGQCHFRPFLVKILVKLSFKERVPAKCSILPSLESGR